MVVTIMVEANSSLCVDLIFINQLHIAVDCGVQFSLLSKFHHQITYYELKCITECPAPYHIFLVISMFVIMRHVNYIYLKF